MVAWHSRFLLLFVVVITQTSEFLLIQTYFLLMKLASTRKEPNMHVPCGRASRDKVKAVSAWEA